MRPAPWRNVSTDLMALSKQGSFHANVQSQLRNAQDGSSRFEARWKSPCEPTKATDWHLAKVAQKFSVAEGRLAPEKSRS